MFLDNKLAFSTDWATAQAVTTTADSTNIIDVTGAGSGNAPAMINGFPAANTAIGNDYGGADGVAIPWLYVTCTVAGTGAGNVTITLKGAPDNGSYGQGSYQTLYTSTAITGTSLLKGPTIVVPVPPMLYNDSEVLPRFYKLTYTVSSTFTGSFIAGLVLNPTTGLIMPDYSNNFTVV